MSDEVKLLPCPFCSDPMCWLEPPMTCFSHTLAATEVLPEDVRCDLRHTTYPAAYARWWNTRPPIGTDEVVERLRNALEPFAAMRLSTEPEISDCMWRSHGAQLREQANAIELRDAQIAEARRAIAAMKDRASD